MRIRLAHALISLSIFGAASCGIEGAEVPSPTKVPVIEKALDRTYVSNKGLVTSLDDKGFPIRVGAAMDSTISESRRFYDTLGSPNKVPVMTDYPDPFTGAPPGLKVTAPLTFDDWKRTFNIPLQEVGETLAEYRERTNAVVYYNKNELGLGRELACAEFDDGTDATGKQLIGVACYVTNYGTAFRDVVNSLPIAVEGTPAKNTVCISWSPSLPEEYQVQFYTYNQDGQRREYAQLDTLGPRPLPQVCMNCHGGSYDATKHLARNARFLPLDPNVVSWAPETPENIAKRVTRSTQEERIRIANVLSTKSPLTSQQIVMLDQLYGGKLEVPGTVSATEWAPPAWNDSVRNRALFDKVIKPNCTTCHAAMQNAPNGDELAIYASFGSPNLLEQGIEAQLCNAFTMPNSQATMLNFWEPTPEPITFIDGKTYQSGAELLLSQLGMGRERCNNIETITDCRRVPDPDALCGNRFSGRACNQLTGECVPYMNAPRLQGEANGVCKMDPALARGCPFPQNCVKREGSVPEGIPGYDGVCMP
jgi:hypothetical protein